jgi:transposase
MRAAMNAIFYLLRTGCPWRYLPRGPFPPRSTVYNIFRKFQGRQRIQRLAGEQRHRRQPRPAHRYRKAKRRHEGLRRPAPPSWFGRNRRLNKDYENLADTLLAFVTLAAIQLDLMRLARA